MKGIEDTGFLAAFANRNDRHHEWAVQVAVDQADFRIYRRNKREAIPLVTPPDR